jgi:hypothetical protein
LYKEKASARGGVSYFVDELNSSAETYQQHLELYGSKETLAVAMGYITLFAT